MPRDISGVYTLPLGNPVIPGTVIDTAWANPTMTDIATQLNNVITRDGLLGYTAPAKFIDGSQAAPAIAFASEGGLGIYRKILNTLAVVSNNQEVALFKDTQINFQKPTNFAAAVSFAFPVSFPGAVTSPLVVGTPLVNTTNIGNFASIGNNLNDGTPASNSTLVVESQFRNANVHLRFSTGTSGYQWTDLAGANRGALSMDSTNQMLMAIGGINRLVLDSNGTFALAAPTGANTTTLLVRQATNGFAVDILADATSLQPKLRLLNNTFTVEHGIFFYDGVGTTLIGSRNTTPVALIVNGTAKFHVSPTVATFASGMSIQYSGDAITGIGNIGGVSDASGGWSMWGGQSVLNGGYIQLLAGGGTNSVVMGTGGVIRQWIDGNGRISMGTGVAPVVASSFLQLKGDFSLMQANSAVFWNNYFDGANFRTGSAGSSLIIKSGGAANNQLQMFGTNDAAAGAAIAPVVIYSVDGLVHFFKTPIYEGSAALGAFGITWSIVAQTDQNNLTSIGVINNASGASAGAAVRILGSSNHYMQTFVLDNAGTPVAETQFGLATQYYRFLFNGTETVRFNPSGTLLTMELRELGVNGPHIHFVTSALGKYIRVLPGGTWEIVNSAYTAAVFSITDAGVTNIVGNINVNVAVAPCPVTSAPTSNTAIPIGSIVQANVSGSQNAFATVNAAVTNLTVQATNAGTNSVINTGTWRCLGAVSSSSGNAIWVRTA